MKTFKELVGSTKLGFKEGRELALKIISSAPKANVNDARLDFKNTGKIVYTTRSTNLTAVLTNEIEIGIAIKRIGYDDTMDVVCTYPVLSTIILPSKYPKISTKVKSDGAIATNLVVNGNTIKLDKRSAIALAKGLFRKPIYTVLEELSTKNPTVLKDFEKDTKMMKTVNAFEKKSKAEKLEKEQEADKNKFKAIKGFMKLEKVSIQKISVDAYNPTNHAYVVFSKDASADDIEEMGNLIFRFDTQIWAIERGYFEAQKQNENILKEMSKIGAGTFVYTTGREEHIMRISI